MKRKIRIFSLAAAVCIALTACGKATVTSTPNKGSTTPEDKLNIPLRR